MSKLYKEAWYFIYGKGSHMNLAGKIILGIPLLPIVLVMITTWALLDVLFSKDKPS